MALGGVVSLSQQDFLDLLDRLLPFEYLAPMKLTGPGYEVYQGAAAIGARVSLAVLNFQLASFITTAPDGGFAQAVVRFRRPTAAAGVVTVKAGTLVGTSIYGRQYRLLADVPFGVADLQQLGTVQALFGGEQYNVKGPWSTAGGEQVPGEIDQVVAWTLDPPFGDATLFVEQVSDAGGGLSSVLNIHGSDRGLPRGPSENVDAYRSRIRTLPDTVSPDAIKRLLATYAAKYPGTTWDFIETWRPTFQEAFDCPSPNAGTPNYQAVIPGAINTNLFVYDGATSNYPPFANRWLDEDTMRGAFIVTVPLLAAVADVGMAYDDTAETPAALKTVNGSRAVNAYDVPQIFSAALQGFYDGFDLQKNAVYAGLASSLQRIKAGGVFVVLEIQGQ